MDSGCAAKAGAGAFTCATPGPGAFADVQTAPRGLTQQGRDTMDTESTARTRTQADAVADVRFGITYGSLNERFWQRLDTTLNLTQVLFGALALTGALAAMGPLAGVAGVVLAVVSALQLTLQPGRRSIDFRDARRAFHALNAKAWQMPLHELDAALEELRMNAPNGLAALNRPALHMLDAQHGHEPRGPALTWAERLALKLA